MGSVILVSSISGVIVVAIALLAWYLKDRAATFRKRKEILRKRAARLRLLEDELATIVSFTEKCTVAASALEQFAAYQQWLVANSLMSWKQNRLTVQTWQQTSGAAESIRLGQVSVGTDVIEELAADMRKTEFPAPEDDHFRWRPSKRVRRRANERIGTGNRLSGTDRR